ncbi:MAG: hypothetical protein AAB374_03090 [Patescibacteria group bacterium]|mgnify:FL=1
MSERPPTQPAEAHSSEKLSREELEEKFRFAKSTGRMMEASMYEEELKNFTKNVGKKNQEIPVWNSSQNVNVNELGTERVSDVDRAYYMACIENLAHAQANAYEDYLKNPEAHLQAHKIQFELFKSENLSPEDIKTKGKDLGEFFGETYDVNKKTEELIEKKSRARLLTQAVFGGVKMAVYGLKMSCYDMPRVIIKAIQKKDSRILLNDRELNIIEGKTFVGTYQMIAALEGLFKVNKENSEEHKWKTMVEYSIGSTEEIMEQAEQYAIPKIRFQEDSASRKEPESSSKTETSHENQGQPDNGAELADKISDKIYEWLENQYVEYLKTGKAPVGFSDIFNTFKTKNLKPEDIKDESKRMKIWMGSLSQWRRRFDTLADENKIKEEQGLNFVDFIFRLLSKDENLKGTDKARSIITPLIKMFLGGKKLKDITAKA